MPNLATFAGSTGTGKHAKSGNRSRSGTRDSQNGEGPGCHPGAPRFFPQTQRWPAKGSAAYCEIVQSVGVKPVVTVWPTFGPVLRTRRYRPVFTFWNVIVLLLVNT